jgi:hypothetical protein
MVEKTQDGKIVFASEAEMKLVLSLAGGTKGAKSAKSEKVRKTSINGAPLDLQDVKVEEKDGQLVFKHPDYKTGKHGGYAIMDLKVARELVEAEQFTDENRRTGTKFVQANGSTIGQNLVLLAEKAGFLDE